MRASLIAGRVQIGNVCKFGMELNDTAYKNYFTFQSSIFAYG